ncbi:hypothetical protein KBI23_19090 [bacterium]|nr:hypothetical protein [bacterium]
MNSKPYVASARHLTARGNRLAIVGLILLATSLPLQAAIATDFTSPAVDSQTTGQLLAQAQNTSQDQKNWDAYSRSKYSYTDASVLAKFWKQNIGEAKSRIGSKLLAGPMGEDTLAQYMVDARIAALGAVNSNQGLTYWQDSSHTYDDAVALAKLWGEPSPWEAKVRVERNLILGNEKIIQNSIELAKKDAQGSYSSNGSQNSESCGH